MLIFKSIFDHTITYSNIPCKCSHIVEIENLKIFNLNIFEKQLSKVTPADDHTKNPKFGRFFKIVLMLTLAQK
jgi:hypothetical protein